MKNLKKVLALVLVVATLLTMTTFASAAFTDANDIEYTEAVDVLTGIGVIDGFTDGSFMPEGNLTRAQMAKMVTLIISGGDDVGNLYASANTFSDCTTNWAKGYIAYANKTGIVAGVGGGKFNPNGNVTGTQAAKMMLCALGYDSDAEGYTGSSWAVNVLSDAKAAGLLDGLTSVDMGKAMTREQAAKLMLNALQADMVKYANGNITIESGDTNVVIAGSKADAITYDEEEDYRTTNTDGYKQLCEEYFPDLVLDDGARDDMGRPSNDWTYKNDAIGTYAATAADSIVVNTTDTTSASGILTSSKYFNLKSSSIADGVEYYLNGDEIDDPTDSLQAGDVVSLYKTSGKVTSVVVGRYELAKIDDVDTDVSAADAKNDISAYVSLVGLDGSAGVGASTYNDTEINGYTAATYKKDAYLAVALNASDEIVDSYVAGTVEGTVSAYKNDDTEVTLGGTKYSISASVDGASVTSFAFDDTNYIAYLTKEGYVLGIAGTAAVQLDEVYYVYGAYYTTAANGSETYYAQVVNMEGAQSEVVIEQTTFVNTFGIEKSTGVYADPDTFYSVDALYTLTDKDAKDGSGDNVNGDAVADYDVGDDGATTPNKTVADPKANNSKLSAVKYDTNTDATYYVVKGLVNGAVTTTASSINMDGASSPDNVYSKAYVNSSTKYILVDGDGTSADITVTTQTGSARIKDNVPVITIATKSGSAYVATIVIAVSTDITDGVSSDEVLYMTASATTKVKDGYEATVYFMDGSNKTVTIDNTYGKGYFTYAVNADGVYELTPIANPVYGASASVAADFVYKDETGYFASTIDSIYDGMISFAQITGLGAMTDKTATFEDLDVTSAQIVDARTDANRSASAYTNEIDNLATLQAAMRKGTVSVSAYVDDGKVLLIAVDTMPSAQADLLTANVNSSPVSFYTSLEDALANPVEVAKDTAITLATTKSASSSELVKIHQDYTSGAFTPATFNSGTTKTTNADEAVDVLRIVITAQDGIATNTYYIALKTPAGA